MTTRRTFLGQAVMAAGAMVMGGRTAAVFAAERTDEEIFREAMAWAEQAGVEKLAIGDAMAAFGRQFLGTPYLGHTLETPGDERLVVNLRAFDCVTYVESMLALARCVRSGKTAFGDFRNQLTRIRYRGGVIDGYPSRLHYFTDWIADNGRKGVVRPMTEELGGTAYTKRIDFMTGHTGSYRQLADTVFVQRMRVAEQRLTAGALYYIPADRIAGIEPQLQNGDVIGTTTSMEGMDVAHTGMVLRRGTAVHFMHAPLSGKKVLVSDGTLAEYIRGIRSHTGIVVGRPLEPEA